MVIDFNGTVRNKEVSLPKLGHGSISQQRVNVPIPDAYTVSITFQSLLADYANIMMSDNFMVQLTENGANIGAGPPISPTRSSIISTPPLPQTSEESQGGFFDPIKNFFAPPSVDSRNRRAPGG